MKVRRAGILLPVTALPGRGAIGDLGPGARRFLAFLERGGQAIWQVLPVGVTTPAFGNSPYSGLGAFGIDPLLLSPEDLRDDGLVGADGVEGLCGRPSSRIAYAAVGEGKNALFARLAATWKRSAPRALRDEAARFREEEAAWVEDLALFLALREAARGRAWTAWPAGVRDRQPAALAAAARRHRRAVERHVLLQFLGVRQWRRLRGEAARRGVVLVGDLPLYVAHDSADVWAHRELFALDEAGHSVTVAGVPPDYFSATGQLWGNPTYRWARHADEGYAWWTARMRHLLGLFDAVRLDHFRGLSAYWEIPAGARTAEAGRWVPGPGAGLLDALARALPGLPVIAEDLGTIDAEVRALMARFALPGMRVLQFAFGEKFPRSEHLPAFHHPDVVVYTGTHDNDTVRGWFEEAAGGPVARRLFAYLGRRISAADAPETLIRLAYGSVASWAVVPLQDTLGLGSRARLNRPGRPDGNWRWRATARALSGAHAERLCGWTETYARGRESGAGGEGGRAAP